MENISELYPVIFDCTLKAVRVVIAIIFSGIIIPWVKRSAIPWLQEKHMCGIIKKFVRAAEKLAAAGTIGKEAKLDYVTALLRKRGIDVDVEVRALIESAVGDLDDEVAHSVYEIIDLLNRAEDCRDAEIAADTAENT